MKNKWTNADAKRAEKMGWMLSESGRKIVSLRSDFDSNIRFKTDRDALEFVVELHAWATPLNADGNWITCRKALLICAGGGE